MLGTGVFFVLAFVTLIALAWSGFELFRDQEDPLGDRLTELQAHAMVTPTGVQRRRGGGGFLNQFLYVISLIPGGDEWLRDTERELAQAGLRNRQALAFYSFFQVVFLLALSGGMLYLQRNNDWAPRFGGMIAALLL